LAKRAIVRVADHLVKEIAGESGLDLRKRVRRMRNRLVRRTNNTVETARKAEGIKPEIHSDNFLNITVETV
jgi:uncharacterized membrane-anchored protein YjiN (DUF445 family)